MRSRRRKRRKRGEKKEKEEKKEEEEEEKKEEEEEEEKEEEENKKTVTHLDTIGVVVRRLAAGSQGQRADGGQGAGGREGRLACRRRNVTWWSTAPPTSPAPDFSRPQRALHVAALHWRLTCAGTPGHGPVHTAS